MTPDEFEFWQRAYLIALERVTAISASAAANIALRDYRTAKATVVQTTYSTVD